MLEGASGNYLCSPALGYAPLVRSIRCGTLLLSELAECRCDRVPIEARQSRLDRSVLTTIGTILLGVIDLSDTTVETAKVVAARTQRALPFVAAKQLVIAPDCGMKYWRRKSRSGRCGRWSKAPRIVRQELTSQLQTRLEA